MASVQVATTHDIPVGSMRAFTVGQTKVLVANVDGAFYAVSNTCTHMGGHLAEGALEGAIVRCPRHGSRFDVRTGANVGPAKIGPIKMSPPGLKTYRVTVEGETVSVEL